MEILRSTKDSAIIEKMKELVSGVKRRILISTAWMGSSVIFDIFQDIPDDIEKRIIIRTSERKDFEIDKPESIGILKKLGFDIAFHQSLHAKFMIIDDSSIVGSSNLTSRGVGGGNEEVNVVFENDKEKADELEKIFREIWEEA